ncbi:alpha/beta fold hydrolase [Glycomyces buryatensis]|uniref:Alpha/beta fold hydrolase n=1 Tax=Glycomyces buryatensis TaxID=2570927 RepID=A0A4S8Q5R9_9ACTN|nr:alpha/beta fold hydrolase [Glycomyces buryatensis]THV39498.1 alpha/beta fold hydrolase [Glycomyces buryatensis]
MSLNDWIRRTRIPEPAPVAREVAVFEPADLYDVDTRDDPEAAPILCCTGDGAGAAAFNALWLKRIAASGRYAAAVSVRGQGGTPAAPGGIEARAHDVVQAVTGIPRQAVLVGHGLGAGWAALAAARYPAAALVMVAPGKLPKQLPKPVGGPPVLLVVSEDDAQSKGVQAIAETFGVAPLTFAGDANDVFKGTNAEGLLDAILSWLDRKD